MDDKPSIVVVLFVTLFGVTMFLIGGFVMQGRNFEREIIKVPDENLKSNMEFCFKQLEQYTARKDPDIKYETEKQAAKFEAVTALIRDENSGLRKLITDLKQTVSKCKR